MSLLHRPDAHDHVTAPGNDVNSYLKIADTATTAQFPQNGTVFELESTCSLNKALQELSGHNVLSAPVWDAAKKCYLGFADVVEFVASF